MTSNAGNFDDSCNYEIASPGASALVESLRAFGYSLQAALADLIDNSITAKSSNVWIEFDWDGRDSVLTIRDDGVGMTASDLVNAMRPGSRSPLEMRPPEDLGRFGLGLKTASFSQCRQLTVASKTIESSKEIRSWDLDYIQQTQEWRLLKEASDTRIKKFACQDLEDSGTLVIWNKLDRLVGKSRADDNKAYKRFLESIDQVKEHLGMVFHRYLEKRNGLNIWINERPVEPWDPFLKNEAATQQLPPEKLKSIHGSISVTPYVLPHRSKIAADVHRKASGPKGWNAQQGIYVYRNERLLVAGNWLGLGFQKEEHCKLARIQVDLPNTMDADWQIDVKKANARPPGYLKPDLKRIAKLTRENAIQIYRHRGKVSARKNAQDHVYLWEQKKRHGKIFYSINRNHPAITQLYKSADKNIVNNALKMMEETVPSAHIMIIASQQPDEMAVPFEHTSYEEFEGMLSILYQSFVESGCTKSDAISRINGIEPFSDHPEYIALFEERIGET